MIRATASRQPAGGPTDPNPQAVSAEGAHQAQDDRDWIDDITDPGCANCDDGWKHNCCSDMCINCNEAAWCECGGVPCRHCNPHGDVL